MDITITANVPDKKFDEMVDDLQKEYPNRDRLSLVNGVIIAYKVFIRTAAETAIAKDKFRL